ncbi:MAG: sugar-binding transcriptional regulator [Pseudomonadota bacterium]
MAKPIPAEFGGDILRWTAWLYHACGQTQQEVAATLGVSRQTVANYLSDALSSGIVKISLDDAILSDIQLGRELADRFGLAAAHIVPSDEGADALRMMIGRAGAGVLANLAGEGDTIGVAAGRTLSALGNAMQSKHRPDLTVVQISGSSIDGLDTSPEACAATIADRFGCRCVNLFAPAYLSDPELTQRFLKEPALAGQFELISTADMLVFGIGELSPRTRFISAPFLDDAMRDRYLELGAVGLVFGRFFDRDGEEIDGPLRGRTVSIAMDIAKTIDVRLAVAGGEGKIEAISAALRANTVTHLVTDHATARKLMV